jgi:hypothetical protein
VEHLSERCSTAVCSGSILWLFVPNSFVFLLRVLEDIFLLPDSYKLFPSKKGSIKPTIRRRIKFYCTISGEKEYVALFIAE